MPSRGPKGSAPLVSVAMAARNYARFLPAAVESVLAQTFADWEMVIVDDDSTDGTPEILQPYLADARIRYLRADALGQVRAKNLGIRFSRGEFVAFLDADDSWEPTKLEKQMARFRDRPDLAVVYCRRVLIDDRGALLPRRVVSALPHGRVLPELFVQNVVCFSSAMARRTALSHVGAFDPQWELGIDYDLWLRLARHYEFDYIDEELVKYRTGHGNLSKKVADRVETALSIMHRARTQRTADAEIPPARVAEAYASTCRTLAYVMRSSEPVAAARWYARALRWPSGRLGSLRGLMLALARVAGGRAAAAAAENASENR